MTEATAEREAQHTDWREVLKVLPVRYSEWDGNVAPEDSDFVTDGYTLFLRSKATSEERAERLASEPQFRWSSPVGFRRGVHSERRRKTVDDEPIKTLWNNAVRRTRTEDEREVTLTEIRDTGDRRRYQYAAVEAEDFDAMLNAQHLRIASLVLDFDRVTMIETSGRPRPALLWRDGEPVGLTMPLNVADRWSEAETVWPETEAAA